MEKVPDVIEAYFRGKFNLVLQEYIKLRRSMKEKEKKRFKEFIFCAQQNVRTQKNKKNKKS